MTVYLIRHGTTEWNLSHRMQGRMDSPLSAEGKNQLARLTDRMKSIPIDAVYASPLNRTRESANIVFPGRELILEDDLMEIALGDWEGRDYDLLKSEKTADTEDFWGKPHLFTARPGGEDFYAVQRRAVALAERLGRTHGDNASIAMVSHAVVIKTLLYHYSGRPMAQFWDPPSMPPASLSILRFGGEGERDIRLFGDISHYVP